MAHSQRCHHRCHQACHHQACLVSQWRKCLCPKWGRLKWGRRCSTSIQLHSNARSICLLVSMAWPLARHAAHLATTAMAQRSCRVWHPRLRSLPSLARWPTWPRRSSQSSTRGKGSHCMPSATTRRAAFKRLTVPTLLTAAHCVRIVCVCMVQVQELLRRYHPDAAARRLPLRRRFNSHVGAERHPPRQRL